MKRNRLIKVLSVCLIVTAMLVTVAACTGETTKKYTVSFTGEGVSIASQTIAEGGFAIEPKSPERDGYDFNGWLLNGEKYVFATTPVTADITLTADWKEKTVNPPTPEDEGDGSAENPYILSTPEALISFSDRVNNPFEEGNETYYKSYFRLGADIDMTGYVYKPAGKIVTDESDDEESGTAAVTVNGFMGNFNGDGHVIKNLTITYDIRTGVDYVGFFGVTERASIYDLTLEDVNYTVTTYSDVSSCGVSYGGLVGLATLTNFTDISVSGTLNTDTLQNNAVHIGGIAGNWRVDDSKQAYIAYMQNCYADTKTTIAKTSGASLENAVNGGLVGYLYTYNGAAAIINSVADGAVYGGAYLGGIVAYVSGNCVSVINCASYANVTATSTSGSYAGGIIGFSMGDNIIMDSFAAGKVKGKKSTSNASYAGNIAAYIIGDSYDMSYDAGTVFANCWYKNDINASGLTNTNTTMNCNVKTDGVFTEEWVRSTLKWSENSMTFDENGKARPAKKTDSDEKYSIIVDGTAIDRTMSGDSYQLVGIVEKPEAREEELFFDYYVADGVRYRYYVPVIKDMTLTSKWTNPSAIVGVYTGVAKLEDRDASKVDSGILYLKKDGTAQWINDTVISGEYTFDGEHILFTRYDSVGDFSGNYDTGKISYQLDAGMTGTVYYYFTAAPDLKLFGNYFADNGDILTFSSNNSISVHVSDLNNDETVSGTYTLNGNVATVTSGKLTDYYSSAIIKINEEDETIVADFVGKDSSFNITSVTFGKQKSVDYSGKAFVGKYNLAYISTTSENYVPSENYVIEFKPDGTMIFSSSYSDTLSSYYMFGDGTLFKFSISGNISTFTYDAERNIFYGDLNRSTKTHKTVIFTPESYGTQSVYAWTDLAGSAKPGAGLGDYDVPTLVVVAGEHYYYIKDKTFMPDAVIVAEQGFVNGAKITIDDVAYRVIAGEKPGYKSVSRIIKTIGVENGTYTYNGETIIIDGIGGATKGEVKGSYRIYDDNLIVSLFDDDTIIGFDYTAAQECDNVITMKEHDKYFGVWYFGKEAAVDEDEDGNDIYEFNDKYYKLVFDGYGHGSVLYFNYDDKDYRFNWGGASGWASYTETDTGIHIEFNEFQKIDFTFFYDMNVAYTTKIFGKSTDKYSSFKKYGYDGTTTPPTLPSDVPGKYTGVEADGTAVVLNVKNNLTVGYKGSVYVTAIFDGDETVYFKINGVSYTFNTTTKVLTYGSENVSLTLAGDVTEIIPEAFCGTWKGTFVATAGGSGEERTIIVNADGTMFYGDKTITATYDATTQTVSGTSSDEIYEITLTYDADKNVMKGTIQLNDKEEVRFITYECSSLTKK